MTTQEALKRFAQRSGLPLPYASKLLDEIPDPVPEFRALGRDWHLRCADSGELSGRGVVLAGGKVDVRRQQAAAAFLSVMVWCKARGLYISAPDYVESLKPGAQAPESYEVLSYADAFHVDLVLLDRFGVERKTMTEFAIDALNELLRKRYENGRPTIVVTALRNGRDWARVYGDESSQLLGAAFDVVKFDEHGNYSSPLRGDPPLPEGKDTNERNSR